MSRYNSDKANIAVRENSETYSHHKSRSEDHSEYKSAPFDKEQREYLHDLVTKLKFSLLEDIEALNHKVDNNEKKVKHIVERLEEKVRHLEKQVERIAFYEQKLVEFDKRLECEFRRIHEQVCCQGV